MPFMPAIELHRRHGRGRLAGACRRPRGRGSHGDCKYRERDEQCLRHLFSPRSLDAFEATATAFATTWAALPIFCSVATRLSGSNVCRDAARRAPEADRSRSGGRRGSARAQGAARPDLGADPPGRRALGGALPLVPLAGRVGAARLLLRARRGDRRVLADAQLPRGCSASARSRSSSRRRCR